MTVSNWELMSGTHSTYVGTNAQEYVVIDRTLGSWNLHIDRSTPQHANVGKGHYSSHNTLYEAIRMAETVTPWLVDENMKPIKEFKK